MNKKRLVDKILESVNRDEPPAWCDNAIEDIEYFKNKIKYAKSKGLNIEIYERRLKVLENAVMVFRLPR